MPYPSEYSPQNAITLRRGHALRLLRSIPNEECGLVATSPPYNIGKAYETVSRLDLYIRRHRQVLQELVRILRPGGSLCWQVGTYIGDDSGLLPLEYVFHPVITRLGLTLRNRIIWHYRHGLNRSRSFSGRHEVILWFTKGSEYVFNLDPVRIPQRYPGKKSYKGPNAGKLSGHPLGKNPGDVWDIPNVRATHPEKTIHPAQFPIELAERLVLALTNRDDLVVDPYAGSGTTLLAARLHQRRAAGSDIKVDYIDIAQQRLDHLASGVLRRRLMNTPVYDPSEAGSVAILPPYFQDMRNSKLAYP